MSAKASCSLIREEMTEFLPPPYRIPKLHPHNYYQADQIKSSNSLEKEKQDLYPWLDKNDPCRTMTDEEILDKYIDLSNSDSYLG